MSKIVGLNRRAFMKSAGMTALVGAAGTIATGASTASAQSSTEIPKLAGGKYDFDTPYNRVGTALPLDIRKACSSTGWVLLPWILSVHPASRKP